MTVRAMVIDDEESIRFSLKRFLRAEGYEVSTAGAFEEAIERMDETDFDIVFTDIILKERTGLDILREIRKRQLNCPVVVFTGVPSMETARQAVRLGAFDYIEKPVRQKELLEVARAALEQKRASDQKERTFTSLKDTFDSVTEAIITVDRNLSVLEINRQAAEICGISRNQAKGRSLADSLSQCSGKCMDSIRESIETGATIETYDLKCNRKHQSERVIHITTSPLQNPSKEYSGGVMVIRHELPKTHVEDHLNPGEFFQNIVGKSRSMQGIFARIKSLSNVRTTVLIMGKSGTGKEVVADAIHSSGSRRDKPLVKVNCAAMPAELLDSGLFGHVAGAFTGAVRDKIGWLQKADGGSIFLDEIGEMPHHMQLRLLRVLETMEFERLGDPTPIRVDVRVLAATNKDLGKEISLGRFREDLYYRLKVIGISLPPLQERREDIPLLTTHFIKKLNRTFHKEITGVSEEVGKVFMEYTWPGNVRELVHAIEHAFVLCSGRMIRMEHLPVEFHRFHSQDRESAEYETIMDSLQQSRWNKTEASARLGISRQSLYRKMKKFNIPDS